jgi:hypothetical protein
VATIAVEIPVASATAEQEGAMLRACTIAAAPDRCESAAVAEGASAFAVVTRDGELGVKLELGRTGTGAWLERHLTFAPEDPPIERWQAVGFAIGTLVGAARSQIEPTAAERASPTTPAPTTTTTDVDPPAHARRPTVEHAVRLDLLGRVGTGTESSARFGGGLAVTARHASGPFASVDVDVDGLTLDVGTPPSALSGRLLTFGMTLGAALPLGPNLHLDLGAGPLLEAQWLWTDQTQTAQSRLIGAARASIGLRQRLGRRFWLGIVAQMGSRFGDTTVTIDGERVDSVPLVFATAALTLGFDVWQATVVSGK